MFSYLCRQLFSELRLLCRVWPEISAYFGVQGLSRKRGRGRKRLRALVEKFPPPGYSGGEAILCYVKYPLLLLTLYAVNAPHAATDSLLSGGRGGDQEPHPYILPTLS